MTQQEGLRELLAQVSEEMKGARSARTGLVHKDYIARWEGLIDKALARLLAGEAPGQRVSEEQVMEAEAEWQKNPRGVSRYRFIATWLNASLGAEREGCPYKTQHNIGFRCPACGVVEQRNSNPFAATPAAAPLGGTLVLDGDTKRCCSKCSAEIPWDAHIDLCTSCQLTPEEIASPQPGSARDSLYSGPAAAPGASEAEPSTVLEALYEARIEKLEAKLATSLREGIRAGIEAMTAGFYNGAREQFPLATGIAGSLDVEAIAKKLEGA